MRYLILAGILSLMLLALPAQAKPHTPETTSPQRGERDQPMPVLPPRPPTHKNAPGRPKPV